MIGSNDSSAEVENFKILRSIWKNSYDKILEIKVMNRRSWNESKKTIIETEKKKIDQKYNKEYQEQYIANKIQVSEARNNSNINKMKKRSELMEKLNAETLHKIKTFARPENDKYRELIKKLVLQGMVKLLEPICLLQVRKIDESFVKKLIHDCEGEYTKLMKDQTGEEFKCTLEIDSSYLANETYENINFRGGVVLRTKDKKITLVNDLESRLRLAYEQHLPVVKNMLFQNKTK